MQKMYVNFSEPQRLAMKRLSSKWGLTLAEVQWRLMDAALAQYRDHLEDVELPQLQARSAKRLRNAGYEMPVSFEPKMLQTQKKGRGNS
jgi:hypothetical protein